MERPVSVFLRKCYKAGTYIWKIGQEPLKFPDTIPVAGSSFYVRNRIWTLRCIIFIKTMYMYRYLLVICCMAFGSSLLANPANQVTDSTLYREIRKADSLLFDAMNRQDLETGMSFFDKDLEFYHDKGGLDNYAQTKVKLAALFQNNRNNNFRRILVAGSLEVYPIPGYGAIESCLHRFCHLENGKDDCGTFKNVMVWKKTDQGWKVTRVLSYDH